MKKTILLNTILLVITVIAIITLSCEDNSNILTDTDNQPTAITGTSDETGSIKNGKQKIIEAQKYFQKEVEYCVFPTNSKNGGEIKKRKTLKKLLQWDKAYVKKLSTGVGVVIPLLYPQELYVQKGETKLKLSQLSYILIYANKQGVMKTEQVTTLPDETYSYSTDKNQPFSGVVIAEDWGGNFIKGYLHKEGQVSAFSLAPTTGGSKTASPDCYTTDYYDCTSRDGGATWDCELYDTETLCTSTSGGSEGGTDYPPTTGGTSNPNPNVPPTLPDLKEPCVTLDSLLDDTGIQNSLSNIWGASNAASTGIPMSGRKEQGGWIVKINKKYSFVPFPSSWSRTICGFTVPLGYNYLNDVPKNAIAFVHSHPFYNGEDTRSVCDGGEASYGTKNEIGAYDQLLVAEMAGYLGNLYFKGYIIEGNTITQFDMWGTSRMKQYPRCGY